jgi:hypothetical protein
MISVLIPSSVDVWLQLDLWLQLLKKIMNEKGLPIMILQLQLRKKGYKKNWLYWEKDIC